LECLQQAHGKTTENGPNITNFIQNTNKVRAVAPPGLVLISFEKIQLWFAGCILSEEDLPQRAKAVEHAINVADVGVAFARGWMLMIPQCCRSLNNFSTMSAITSGLNSPPVRRLNRTWKRVHHNHMALFKTCEETISSHRGFVKYRSLMNSAIPPCVPFIGEQLVARLESRYSGSP
jgi:son of sevenless-like protein